MTTIRHSIPRTHSRAAFRRALNAACATGSKHKHGRYAQRARAYGDYLYFQDRDKFDDEWEAWKRGEMPWISNPNKDIS
jgi:hypothetical protein